MGDECLTLILLPPTGIDGVGNPPSLPEFVGGRRVAQPIRLDQRAGGGSDLLGRAQAWQSHLPLEVPHMERCGVQPRVAIHCTGARSFAGVQSIAVMCSAAFRSALARPAVPASRAAIRMRSSSGAIPPNAGSLGR